MDNLWLRVQAPFAAFRSFQAGVYRSTAPIMPPSTAFGLVLNLAGIEMRGSLSDPTTLIRPDVPALKLAIGRVAQGEMKGPPKICKTSLYQQLHKYPVGSSGKELAPRTHGAKYGIAPVRRELLVGLDIMVGVQTSDSELIQRVGQGLCGELDQSRYGLPFAGDNNLLFDRIDIVDEPEPTFWYTQIQADKQHRDESFGLTVGIDRADTSKTTSFLYAPIQEADRYPPEGAWTWTPREPS